MKGSLADGLLDDPAFAVPARDVAAWAVAPWVAHPSVVAVLAPRFSSEAALQGRSGACARISEQPGRFGGRSVGQWAGPPNWSPRTASRRDAADRIAGVPAGLAIGRRRPSRGRM